MKKSPDVDSGGEETVHTDRFTSALLCGILILGFFLRIYQLDSKSLWLDEIGEVLVASAALPGVFAGASGHLSPPLDYLILHFFLILGNTNWIARLPAVLFGVGSIGVIYLAGSELYSKNVGLISAFFLAISPYCIWYSQEARMYSLFLLLALLSFYFFFRSLKSDSVWMWGAYLASSVLALYTHYFAFFILIVQGIFLGVMYGRERSLPPEKAGLYQEGTLVRFFLCSGAMALLFLPQLGIFLAQTGRLERVLWYGIPADLRFFYQLVGMLLSLIGPQRNGGFLETGIFPFVVGSGIASSLVVTAAFAVMFGIIIVGIRNSVRSRFNETVFLLVWFLLPIALTFILSVLRGPMTTARNMIFILPAVVILAAQGIAVLGDLFCRFTAGYAGVRKNPAFCTTGILVVLVFLTIPVLDSGYREQKEDWQGTSGYLSTQVSDGDLIITLGVPAPLLSYYYTGNAEIISLSGDLSDLKKFLLDRPGLSQKIWIVSTPHLGMTTDTRTWLDARCRLERAGLPNGKGNIYRDCDVSEPPGIQGAP